MSNIISRVKRAQKHIAVKNRNSDDAVIKELEKTKIWKSLGLSVRSQIKKAISLYIAFQNDKKNN